MTVVNAFASYLVSIALDCQLLSGKFVLLWFFFSLHSLTLALLPREVAPSARVTPFFGLGRAACSRRAARLFNTLSRHDQNYQVKFHPKKIEVQSTSLIIVDNLVWLIGTTTLYRKCINLPPNRTS
jgi:hypothetical protein